MRKNASYLARLALHLGQIVMKLCVTSLAWFDPKAK